MPATMLTVAEIFALAQRVLASNGCDAANAAAAARTIAGAERDRCLSHGLFRLPGYVASLRSGKVDGRAAPRITRRTPVILNVDGGGGLAPLALEHVGPDLARAAKEYGVAAAAIVRSHHFAALWPEAEMLAAEGLIALTCLNYVPVVAPHGGREPIFGTNPLCIAWPRPGREPVVLDMATSAMARGEVQIAARERRTVPLGAGLDADGQPTTDPAAILRGVLLPFGGHKGSGLALMVELLAAAAIGERFSFESAIEDNHDGGPPRGGQLLLALSPELLGDSGWAEHAERFFARYASIEGARLPGERRLASRRDPGPRDVDVELLDRVRALERRV